MVKAEVPGIDPDGDVDITLAGNQLQISVRREERFEHQDKEGYRSEFRYGTFSRTVSLPAPVSQDDIRASYTDGILEVRVPLPEESAAGSRKVRVSRGSEFSGAAGQQAPGQQAPGQQPPGQASAGPY